jgi:hypothetical protein
MLERALSDLRAALRALFADQQLRIFPLRCLSAANLDPANIGSGGQLLLARENRIVLEERSRDDFVALLRQLGDRARARVPTEVSELDATEC